MTSEPPGLTRADGPGTCPERTNCPDDQRLLFSAEPDRWVRDGPLQSDKRRPTSSPGGREPLHRHGDIYGGAGHARHFPANRPRRSGTHERPRRCLLATQQLGEVAGPSQAPYRGFTGSTGTLMDIAREEHHHERSRAKEPRRDQSAWSKWNVGGAGRRKPSRRGCRADEPPAGASARLADLGVLGATGALATGTRPTVEPQESMDRRRCSGLFGDRCFRRSGHVLLGDSAIPLGSCSCRAARVRHRCCWRSRIRWRGIQRPLGTGLWRSIRHR